MQRLVPLRALGAAIALVAMTAATVAVTASPPAVPQEQAHAPTTPPEPDRGAALGGAHDPPADHPADPTPTAERTQPQPDPAAPLATEPDPPPPTAAPSPPAVPPPVPPAAPPAAAESPPVTSSAVVRPLPPEVRAAMTGVSWHPGCPVGLDDLALLELDHWGFDGQVHTGQLVVAAHVAGPVSQVFAELFAAGFPIERMERVEVYGGDDDRSMDANNTHAFNCRPVAGTDRWSEHAFGTAIDLNPVQNPYVRDGRASPPAGAAHIDRTDVRTGMIVRPGPVVDAFAAIGWRWGGDWRSVKDYQHFSASGR